MKLTVLAKMPWSVNEGWPELAQRHPAVLDVVASLALPLALLPPAMLYFAGTRYPEAFAPLVPTKDWAAVALVFLLAEMLTFVAMGWLIKKVAQTYELHVDRHDAYLLAAITPVPLWLASLGLLIPSLIANLVLSAFALGISCALLYNGLMAWSREHESMAAVRVVHVVTSAGLAAWALLLVLAFF
ncbi:YIP1 family protein [Ideonella sp.]|uniref:YIP1 family protein n=1 Tax=Ideonella sp. TaxID=1929293 RepID=UPI0035B4B4AD